jgi:potassium voltage-gated channel Shaker-related subfamily A protein 1
VITINVSGDRYQTYLSTLELYPDTLLGDEDKRQHYWNPESKEYFFDRHRACFEAILYYYQSSGRLRRPDFVPLDTFLEEISFFQLGREASTQVHQAENIKKMEQSQLPQTLWRRYIWFYVEFPQYSFIARVINVVSLFFTILSCVSLSIESLPDYNNHWNNICQQEANISLNSTFVPSCSALFTSPFFIIQTICIVFFTTEFFLRLISTPSYYRFLFSFYNWIDLGAIVPYYVFLIIQLTNQDVGLDPSVVISLRLLRVLRFSRIFKLYLVFRRLKSLRVLSATIKESLTDFVVMITILTLLAFLFGAATYFAEQQINGDMFDSIPAATYWGIMTVTGVG